MKKNKAIKRLTKGKPFIYCISKKSCLISYFDAIYEKSSWTHKAIKRLTKGKPFITCENAYTVYPRSLD